VDKLSLGKGGEDVAVAAALAEGYQVLARNWRCALGELDLVLRKGKTIVFVEVKTRTGRHYGEAWESVTYAKQARIRRVARWYAKEMAISEHSFRFDVFAVEFRHGRWQYRWFKNAF